MKQGIHPETTVPLSSKICPTVTCSCLVRPARRLKRSNSRAKLIPLVKLEISSTSHPFYTGKSKLVDTAGRVDKFMSRYGKSRK